MNAWWKLPRFFQRKIAAVGIVGILIGTISTFIYFITADRIQLLLGGFLFLACLGKALMLWLCAAGEHYYVLTGICMIRKQKPAIRLKSVTIRNDEGKEINILVDRKLKIEDGKTYHFYFQGSPNNANAATGTHDIYEHTLIGMEPVLSEDQE